MSLYTASNLTYPPSLIEVLDSGSLNEPGVEPAVSALSGAVFRCVFSSSFTFRCSASVCSLRSDSASARATAPAPVSDTASASALHARCFEPNGPLVVVIFESPFVENAPPQTDRWIGFIPEQIPRINIYRGDKIPRASRPRVACSSEPCAHRLELKRKRKGRRITTPFWGWRGEKRVRSTRRHPERRKPSRRVRRNLPGRSPPCRTAEAQIRRRSTM